MWQQLQFDWQTTATMIVVIAAAVVVVRSFLISLRSTTSGSGCGSCSKCPVSKTESNRDLVQLK